VPDLVSCPVLFSRPPSLLVALTVAFVPLVAVACSAARYSTEPGAPTFVMPAHFAEGKGGPAPSGGAPTPSATPPIAASGSAAPAPPALTPSTAPDPTPLRQAEQVEYELELKEGKVHVVSVQAVTLPSPVVTPRRLGRYAIELSIGPELIERVRFDFPGTAADDPQVGPKKPLFAPLTLSERAIARVKLLLPQSPRVRRAVLVDRALNTVTPLEWPLPAVPKVASVPSASGSVKVPAMPPASGSVKVPAMPPASASAKVPAMPPASASAKVPSPAHP
jgi:hypothetical protein